nr:reverse transcriptase domain-containing protein [Tanacetum cinerariifolium]
MESLTTRIDSQFKEIRGDMKEIRDGCNKYEGPHPSSDCDDKPMGRPKEEVANYASRGYRGGYRGNYYGRNPSNWRNHQYYHRDENLNSNPGEENSPILRLPKKRLDESEFKKIMREFIIAQKTANDFVKNQFYNLKAKVEQGQKNHQAVIQDLETNFGRTSDHQSLSPPSTLPSNTQTNPKPSTLNEKPYRSPPARNKHVNVVFTRSGMPNYGKFLKDLVSNKSKMEQIFAAFLTEECSVILQNKIPAKLGDPRSFLIPCKLANSVEYLTLADLGVSINLIPYSLYAALSGTTLKSTRMSIRLANHTYQYPIGVAENMLVQVGKFVFHVDLLSCEWRKMTEYIVPAGRVVVSTGRYIVPAGRVVVSTGRSVVPAGNVIVVSAGRLSVIPTGRVIQNGNIMKRTERDHDGRVIILPPMTAEEHIAVKMESKARTTLLQSISDDHVALTLKTKGGLELLSFDDFYYKLKTLEVDIKGYSTFSSSQSIRPSHSAFVSATSASKKMSYGDSLNYSSTTTYSVPSNSQTGSHRYGNVIEDVLQLFVADTEPEQQLAYEDFEQIEKLDLEEMDLKWQMAMLSVRVHKAKGGNDKQRYSSFKIKEIGKKEEDLKALINVDTLVDWTDHDSESDRVIATKEFESAAKIYNLITGADSKEASTADDAREFALMGVTSEENPFSAAEDEGIFDSGCSRSMTESAAKIYNLITGADSKEASTTDDAREFALMGVTSEENPFSAVEDEGIFDSGCSRSMTDPFSSGRIIGLIPNLNHLMTSSTS